MSTRAFPRRILSGTVAALALIAGLGGPAMAQTATTQAPAVTAQSDMPAPLAGLNLGNLRTETKRDGLREIEGRTADGVEIEAKIDMAGNIVEVESDDGALPQSLIDALLPEAARANEAMSLLVYIDEIKLRPDHIGVKGNQQNGEDAEVKFDLQGALVEIELDDSRIPDALIQSLLPQAVRDADEMAQFARIDEIGTRHGNFVVKGEDQSGRDMSAAFDQEGRVLRFGSDDGPKHRRGERGHDRDDHDRRGGPRDMRQGDHAGHGEGRRDGGREGGPRMGERAAAPAFDAVAVNQRLADAGYSQFGFLRAQGPGAMLDATNPQGEAVTLELDPAGEVVRETAR